MTYSKREHGTLAQIGEALCQHRRFEHIGAYYAGLAAMCSGKGSLSTAKRLLEQTVEHTRGTYRAKALLSLGALAWYQGDVSTETACYSDALKITEADYSTRIELNRAIAFNFTLAGEYQSAIQVLERAAPVAKALARVNPRLYYDLLNNYAVNLCAVGRLTEALFYASMITASALARHIPEWRETKAEIEAKRIEQEARAVIVVVPKQRKEGKQKKSSGNSYHLKQWHHPDKFVLFSALIIANPPTKHLIQSRLRYSFIPHAPPFLSGK